MKGKSAQNTLNCHSDIYQTYSSENQSNRNIILLRDNRPYSQSVLKMLTCPIMEEYAQVLKIWCFLFSPL